MPSEDLEEGLLQYHIDGQVPYMKIIERLVVERNKYG
jgi:hypothetical protein